MDLRARDDDGDGTSATGGPVGAALPLLAGVVAGLVVEVVALVVVTVLYAVGTAEGDAGSVPLALGSALLALGLAALLAWCALQLARGRSRGRVPALVWQVLQTLVALQVLLEESTGSGTWWAALGVAALGGAVAVALLTRAAGAALPHGREGGTLL